MDRSQYITQISVRSFKSLFNETSVEVRPLTILAGANSSGKSSIMQPLLMMKQTLEAPYHPGDLMINGPNVAFKNYEQFVPLNDKEPQKLTILVGMKVSEKISRSIEITFNRNQDGEIILEQQREINSSGRAYTLHLGMKDDELRNEHFIVDEFQAEDLERIKFKVGKDRLFLGIRVYSDGEPLHTFRGFTLLFEEDISRIIHIPNARVISTKSASPTYKNIYPGTFDNYVASIIQRWDTDQRKTLAADLRALGLTSHVGTHRVSDSEIEVRVGRTLHSDQEDMVNLTDVGFGVSQVLPVLVALQVAEPGQLVYIEQPELHLHPRAQVALAGILAEAAKRGVRLVVETHSSLLLLGVQTLIAEGNLDHDTVMLHWFRRGEDGMTTVRSEQPDENGAYGDWPEDFYDVEMQAQKRYIDAVTDRELGVVDGETSGD